MSTPSSVSAVLGTMSIGSTLDNTKTEAVLNLCKDHGVSEVDTAIMYVNGESEKTLGKLSTCEKFKVATKANPWFCISPEGEFSWKGTGGLDPEIMKKQLAVSLQNLKSSQVELFYLHAPDHSTPILETLNAVQELYKEGKFKRLGLSNYAAWQVVEIYQICKQHEKDGWCVPTVYQGMYNMITRAVEAELFPALKACGDMQFYAYNPLAGGLLSGKYSFDDDPTSGRFNGSTQWGKVYRKRFWNAEVFQAMKRIQDILQASKKEADEDELSLVSVAFRWLTHHSQLASTEKKHAVIIGGSSLKHIESNLKAMKMGPLPEDILKVIDEAWDCARTVCPVYFR